MVGLEGVVMGKRGRMGDRECNLQARLPETRHFGALHGGYRWFVGLFLTRSINFVFFSNHVKPGLWSFHGR